MPSYPIADAIHALRRRLQDAKALYQLTNVDIGARLGSNRNTVQLFTGGGLPKLGTLLIWEAKLAEQPGLLLGEEEKAEG